MLPSLNRFFSQKGNPRIRMNLVSHTLLTYFHTFYRFLALLFKKFKPISSPLWYIYILLDNYPSTLIKKFIMIRLTRVAHKWAINYSPHMQQPAGCLAPLLLQDRMSFCQLANFIILIIKEMQLLHAIACPYLWHCSVH